MSFTVPAAVKMDDWSHRVTADISITCDSQPVSCQMSIQINGGANIFCQPPHYLLGDSVQGLDITRYVNYGSASTFAVWIKKNGEWTGANCAAHPTFDINVTVRCWGRPIVGNPSRALVTPLPKNAGWDVIRNQVFKWSGR
jgi:hypothetical protein